MEFSFDDLLRSFVCESIHDKELVMIIVLRPFGAIVLSLYLSDPFMTMRRREKENFASVSICLRRVFHLDFFFSVQSKNLEYWSSTGSTCLTSNARVVFWRSFNERSMMLLTMSFTCDTSILSAWLSSSSRLFFYQLLDFSSDDYERYDDFLDLTSYLRECRHLHEFINRWYSFFY